MKRYVSIVAVLFCSCHMTMPRDTRVKSLVRRYLDSVYHKKVDSVSFSEVRFVDSVSFRGSINSVPDSILAKMSTAEKMAFYKSVREIIKKSEGYDVFCKYRVYDIYHTNLFKVDTAIRKVIMSADLGKTK